MYRTLIDKGKGREGTIIVATSTSMLTLFEIE